jgi:hypothetical protein
MNAKHLCVQRTTVSGFTITTASRQPDQTGIRHIMLNRFANTKELVFFSRCRNNAISINPSSQDSNLRLEQLKLRVVPWLKPLNHQRDEKERYFFHAPAFRLHKHLRNGRKTAYLRTPIFLNPPGLVTSQSKSELVRHG